MPGMEYQTYEAQSTSLLLTIGFSETFLWERAVKKPEPNIDLKVVPWAIWMRII
jgi:hypothetical protein